MSFKTEAVVLKVRPFKNADKIYYLFTPNEGIIKVVLRSAGKPGNKLAGHLLPFARVKVMIGRGRLDHMAGVSTLNDYSNLRDNLRNLSLASSIAEIFLGDDSGGHKHDEFKLLNDIFSLIDNQAISIDQKLLLVRIFLWKYLSLAGWRPQLDNCHLCGKNIQAGQYLPGRGIICRDHFSNRAVPINQQLVNWLDFIVRANWAELLDLNIDKNLNKDWLRVSQLFYQAVYDRPSQALKLFTYG